MTAQKIADRLGVKQQNIRRSLEQLSQWHLIMHGKIIIEHFTARPYLMAHNAYVRVARAEFEQLFGEAYNASKHKRA